MVGDPQDIYKFKYDQKKLNVNLHQFTEVVIMLQMGLERSDPAMRVFTATDVSPLYEYNRSYNI